MKSMITRGKGVLTWYPPHACRRRSRCGRIHREQQGLLVADGRVAGYVPQEPLGRAGSFPHDGDAAIGNEAPVLVARPDPDFPALIDGERDLALGACAPSLCIRGRSWPRRGSPPATASTFPFPAPNLPDKPDGVPLQHGRQVRMLRQCAGLDSFELSGAAIEYGIDVAARQPRDMHQAVDIGMPGVDRSPAQRRVPLHGSWREPHRSAPPSACSRRSEGQATPAPLRAARRLAPSTAR